MSTIHSVTVYCSSSRHVAALYLAAADALGRGIACAGWALVYGGNHLGCMAALADGARAAGGRVVGITPQLLMDKGLGDKKCDELIVTPDIRQRKALMEERGDAFVALPGGIGTLEEIFEILVGRYLGCHSKPIVLLNIAGFYEPLLRLLEHGLEQKFIREPIREMLYVADRVESALDYLRQQIAVPAKAQTPRLPIE
jgi:hypothetical protein